MFLQLPAPLILMIFIAFPFENSFSKGPAASIQVSCLTQFPLLLDAMFMSIWHHFQKKTIPKMTSNKNNLTSKRVTMNM